MKQTENIMGTKKVLPLLVSMSIPPMVSMMIQALYNIVDSMYVARISENALTAVSLAYPLQNLILAVSVGFGIGLNACVARALGAKNVKETGSGSSWSDTDSRARYPLHTGWPSAGKTLYRHVYPGCADL